jgi:hypothetical protein
LLHALCIFLRASVVFVFVFICFVFYNKWLDHIMFLLEEMNSVFHLPRTLRFSLLSFQRVFSFSATAFSLHFSPWFLFRSSFIFASRYIWTSCDDLKFDNKFEVPVMYSTAIPGSLLRYT